MAWLRSMGVALAAVVVAALGAWGCGGGEDGAEVDLSGMEEVVAGAVGAVSRPGEVFYAKAVWDQPEQEQREIHEVWLDADNGRFRRERRVEQAGELSALEVAVGADWTATYYESLDNSIYTHTMTAEDRAEGVEAGIDNFAYYGAEHLAWLARADERRVVGESAVEGQPVVLVETTWFMEPSDDWPEGLTYMTIVGLDKSNLLPVQIESKLIEPNGEEQSYGPFMFEVMDYLSPDDLSPDFFSPQSLEELVTGE